MFNFDMLAVAPIWYVAFLFSTVCHEAAHALVAKWGGDDTAYAGGQVTLDPMPHIRREPFGLVVIPLLMLFTSGAMIGWGSAPFNPFWQIRYPRRAALMALAGPITNFLLAGITALIMLICVKADLFVPGFGMGLQGLLISKVGVFGEGLATFLSVMFLLNVLLGVFNLLPVPPLDGYGVLGLFLPEDLTLKLLDLSRSPGFAFFGLFLAWQLFPILVAPVLRNAIYLLANFLQ